MCRRQSDSNKNKTFKSMWIESSLFEMCLDFTVNAREMLERQPFDISLCWLKVEKSLWFGLRDLPHRMQLGNTSHFPKTSIVAVVG